MARNININQGALIIALRPKLGNGNFIETSFCTKTSIIETLTGIETRNAIYHRPLIKEKFTALSLDKTESNYIRDALIKRGRAPVGIPVWMDECIIQEEVAASDSVLVCECRNRLFQWFRYALLWSSPTKWDIVVPDIIANDQETLKPYIKIKNTSYFGVSQSHKAGASLIPLAFGYLKIPDSDYLCGDVSEVDIDFEERQGIESYEDDGFGGPGTTKLYDYLSKQCIEIPFGAPATNGVINNGVAPPTQDENAQWWEAFNAIPTTSDFEAFPLSADWEESPSLGNTDDLEFEPISGGVSLPYIAYESTKKKLTYSYKTDRYGLQKVLRHYEYHDGKRGHFTIQEPIPKVTRRRTEYVATQTNVRYNVDELTVTCLNPDTYEFDCDFIECNPATFNANDVQTGGDLEQKLVYLYRFRKGLEDANRFMECTKLFCNYGYAMVAEFEADGHSDLNSKANDPSSWYVFQASDITHGNVSHSEDMLGEEIEITLNGVARNSIMENHNTQVTVEIYKIDLLNRVGKIFMPLTRVSVGVDETVKDRIEYKRTLIDNVIPKAKSIFKGVIESKKISSSGEVELKVSSVLRILRRSMSRYKIQRQCNYPLFSECCGLDVDDYIGHGIILNYEEYSIRIRIPYNQYLFNWPKYENKVGIEKCYFIGATLLLKDGRRFVVKEAEEEEELESLLSKTFIFTMSSIVPESNGTDEVLVFPWCDHTIECCKRKFGFLKTGNSLNGRNLEMGSIIGNVAHFGGSPWLPSNNKLEELSVDEDDGKK